jgi:hypothetical protein
MSNTAGLSAQEYVAVNPTAVAAVLTGLASGLILLSYLWLAVPLLAIVLGLVALRQISHSNGTQTGGLLAWGGIVLAVGCGGYCLGDVCLQELRERPMRAQVLGVCDSLEKAIVAKDYQGAWALFSDKFRSDKKLDFEAFRRQWMAVQMAPMPGNIVSLKSNGFVILLPLPNNGQGAETSITIHWQRPDLIGNYQLYLRKGDSGWQIDDLPILFVTPVPAEGGPGGPGGPRGPGSNVRSGPSL